MKEKIIWTREYKITGRFVWGHGAYAIRKYYTYDKNKPKYAISISPMRKFWSKGFFDFSSAKKFAKQLVDSKK